MAAIPVVLDVDTGVDDACALLLAALHPALDLRAVTCVGGNAAVDAVVANTLTVLDAAERTDVPVARAPSGRCSRTRRRPARARPGRHGRPRLGEVDAQPDPRHAVELLRDVLLEAAARDDDRRSPSSPRHRSPTSPCCCAPTRRAKGLREIVFMGGAAQTGNATASAEFNVFHDPEAAAVVLDAAADLGIPVTMYGLDVFYDPRVTGDRAASSSRRGAPARQSSPGGCSSSSASASGGRAPSATPAPSAR